MAAFLSRALSLPASATDFFTDDDDTTFEADINRLAAAGITKGCNPPANNLYCPDEKVTRCDNRGGCPRRDGCVLGASFWIHRRWWRRYLC
jgi:hypothetical protein